VDEAIKSGDWDGCGPVGNGRGRQKKTNDLGALKSELCKRPTKILIKFYDVHHGFILEFQTDSGTFREERERETEDQGASTIFFSLSVQIFSRQKSWYTSLAARRVYEQSRERLLPSY
jgi:hypothetical protein